MASESESLVVPAITSSDLKTVHPVRGVIVGVAPYVAPTRAEAEDVVMLGEDHRYDPSGKVVPQDLRSMLEDDEVVYLVVGKWPPQTGIAIGHPPAAIANLSQGARRLSRMLNEGARVNLVVGPWPPMSESGGKKTCDCCGQLLP